MKESLCDGRASLTPRKSAVEEEDGEQMVVEGNAQQQSRGISDCCCRQGVAMAISGLGEEEMVRRGRETSRKKKKKRLIPRESALSTKSGRWR